METLKHFGLETNFSKIFCREFNQDHKKINKFKNAILKLGISPSMVVAFENEEVEIADAREAGIQMIIPIITSNNESV